MSLFSSSVSRLQGLEGSSSTTRCFFFPSPIPQFRESQSEGMGMRLYPSLLRCHTQIWPNKELWSFEFSSLIPSSVACTTVRSIQVSAMLSTLRGEKKTDEGNWWCFWFVGGGSAHSVSIISGDPSFWSQPPSFSRKCGNETNAVLLGRPNLVSQSQTLSHTKSKWESGPRD